jgi:hypothetical protein
MARKTLVIPTDRFLAAAAAALTLAAQPGFAQQQPSNPPKPTVGESANPRQDGTTRSGAQRPTAAASALQQVPKSEHDEKHPPGYKKGESTPRDSGSGSILGTPK